MYGSALSLGTGQGISTGLNTDLSQNNLNSGVNWSDLGTMGKLQSGMNLAGSALSLADMINNWGVQKKAMKLNMANVRQSMEQDKLAFDRSVARQDRSLANVNEANERAMNI